VAVGLAATKETEIFADGALVQPAVFDPSRLAGDYAFYDDGWRCSLSLRQRSERGFDARFRSYDRTEGAFDVDVWLDPELPHRLQLTVSGGFNEVQRQTYRGFAFTRGAVGIAGVSDWKGAPFGFFARRHPPYSVGPAIPGTIAPTDFVGSFNLYCDGEHGTLELSEQDGAEVRGTLREQGGATLPVTASIDAAVPYHAVIAVHDVGSALPPLLSVWMFVRPRTALAGWLDWGDTRLGCYLTRFK
jgi:hypothetical protein